MPAKKKISNEGKTTEINVKSDMKRCKQIEERLNESINISDEDETTESNESNESNDSNKTNETNERNDTKQSISKSDTNNKYDNIIYSPDTYVFKFGKYKGMKAKDVKKLGVEKTNKKSGETFMCNAGKHYLEFLLTLQWLCKSDKKVIAKILFND